MNTGMYKVYDNENKKWITDECMVDPDGTVYSVIHKNFGRPKLEVIHTTLSSNENDNPRFIIYRSIYLTDKAGNMIFEGNVVRNKDGKVGLIHYSTELASNVFIHVKENKFYPLNEEMCKQMKILGNVIDDAELLYM